MNPRAQDFARYADLIRRQIDALAADDLDEVARLGAERDRLAARIDSPRDRDDEVIAMLDRCAELDARFIAMLIARRNAAFEDLRASDERRSGLRAYGSTPVATPALDLRL